MKKRINVAGKHLAILQEEFNVSSQTIRNALRYFTESPLAQEIRSKAKQLLEQEAKEVVIDTNDL